MSIQLRPRSFRALIIILTVILNLSCQDESKKSSSSNQKNMDEKLIIITPHPKRVVTEFENSFIDYYKKKFNKTISLEFLDLGGTSDDLKFIKSEFSKNKEGINVDIFWGGGVAPYLALKELSLLLKYIPPPEILSKIPADVSGIPLYDSEHYWYGAALASFGFICNKVLLDLKKLKPPKDWEDLGSPKYLGVIGSADPRHSGSTHTMYSIILQAYGWEKGWEVIMKMGANVRQYIRSSSGILKEVTTGDSICGLAIDYYAWAKIAELGSDKISFTMPEKLTILNPDAMGILKGAPNTPAAKAFIDFVLSEAGQSLWLLPKGAPGGPKENNIGRLSVMPSLFEKIGDKSIVPINPFKLKGYIKYDDKNATKLWSITNDMMGTLVIDPKANLMDSWKKVISSGMKPDVYKTFISVPINQDQALKYAEKWKDELFRNNIINQWLKFNKIKFNKVKKATE